VFELGNSLREARLRQGLDLARVETDTKIRVKYLQALEDERFDLLPAETYVKGFLRTYADYLGLDGQLYLDEFRSRFSTSDEPPVTNRLPRRRTRQRSPESHFVVVALTGIVAVTVLVIVAWQFGTGSDEGSGGESPGVSATTGVEALAALPDAASEPVVEEPAAPEVPPGAVEVILNAVRGDVWVGVRAGSSRGELLHEGTLEQGQSVRFARKKLWIQYDAGQHLDVKLGGERVDVPEGAAILVLSPKGVRVVPAG
jgi:cytoskeletal protein RodZ